MINQTTSIVYVFTVFILLSYSGFSQSSNSSCEDLSSQADLTYTIVKRLKSPCKKTLSLAIDNNTNLWISHDNGKVRQIDQLTGAEISYFWAPDPMGAPAGIEISGPNIWIICGTIFEIHKVDKVTGNSIFSFDAPFIIDGVQHTNTGLGFDGEFLWVTNYQHDSIAKMDTLGNVVRKEKLVDLPYVADMTFIGPDLWLTSASNNYIYKLDSATLDVVEKAAYHGSTPTGIDFDGEYLWVADNQNQLYNLNDSIYKLKFDVPFLGINATKRNSAEIEVYPNPATNYIYINTPIGKEDKYCNLHIYNLNGIEVYFEEGFNYRGTKKVNTTGFESGLYLVSLDYKEVRITKQIVIVR